MLEAVRMALQMLVRNPGRSSLTMLGLAIGVGAFIAMVAFGQGARRSVLAQFEVFGTNVVRIDSRIGERVHLTRPPQPLTHADVEALRRESSLFTHVVPLSYVQAPASARGQQELTSVNGTTPPFFELRRWGARSGGLFDDSDVRSRAKVCVLGATPAQRLFDGTDPLGQSVTIAGTLTCRVLGVLEAKGTSTGGQDLDDVVILPITTYEAYLGLPQGLARIEVQPPSPALIGLAKQQATEIMRRSHRLLPTDADDFKISSPLEVLHAADRVSTILSELLAAIAAVSLLVGGIGIMNIQLVAVAERTHEIGIRAAIGAAPRQILSQFLAEAIVLSFVGTAVGAGGGTLISLFVGNAMGWQQTVDIETVAFAVLFGLVVGLLFGYAPARRAARMDPIEALRHE